MTRNHNIKSGGKKAFTPCKQDSKTHLTNYLLNLNKYVIFDNFIRVTVVCCG